jgi:hypothetical protein
VTPGDIVLMRWRIGRKVGRTIYAMVGSQPSDDDILIGMMDHENIAAIAVHNHNNSL